MMKIYKIENFLAVEYSYENNIPSRFFAVSYKSTIALLIGVICYLVIVEAQGFNALSYTILKLHTLKTETEECKNQYVSSKRDLYVSVTQQLDCGFSHNITPH